MSKERVSADHQCGGCPLQHMSYPLQLEMKQNQVKNVMKKVAHLEDVPVHPVMGMDHPWGYRNKVQLPVGEKNGRLITGFYQPRSHRIMEMDEPCNIQDEMIRTVPGLEDCRVQQYGYAIEYDAIDPIQLKPTLEIMTVENFYTAGQINGTSGYEEAAGQGLMAGINAALKNQKREPLILKRDEAYIGVMIDDLVTKGTLEPYRLLTSRAEYRLLLRHDNVYRRLSHLGYDAGLVQEEKYKMIQKDLVIIDEFVEESKRIKIPHEAKFYDFFASKNSPFDYHDLTLHDGIKRPGIELQDLLNLMEIDIRQDLVFQIQVEIKYEGYIKKAKKDAEKLRSMEHVQLIGTLDYNKVMNLSIEGRQKLTKVKPVTLGQASRISGVNPADIAVLAMYLKQEA